MRASEDLAVFGDDVARVFQLGERFWAKVDQSDADGCWPFMGSWRSRYGYGRQWLGGGLSTAAHRVAWELVNGPMPAGSIARHRCDNPICCRPDHIEPGDYEQNLSDALDRDRLRRDCYGRFAASEVA